MIPLGPFHLNKPIGHGGMGAVWSGVHFATKTPVAVKLLTGEVTKEESYLDAFRNEVRAMAALDHPNIVSVYDFGEVDDEAYQASFGTLPYGAPYLAMELVTGGTLIPLAGRMAWDPLKTLTLAMLNALAHAHARGVVHRDLKPGNVLVNPSLTTIKLTDFGLAHALRAHDNDEGPFQGGTPAYMAPEQFVGDWREYGPWTDLYALGCMIYALIHGKPIFSEAKNLPQKVMAHMKKPMPPLNCPFPVPSGFEGWMRRLLGKHPTQRFRRAADALFAFQQLPAPPKGESWSFPSGSQPEALDRESTPLSDLPTMLRDVDLSAETAHLSVRDVDGTLIDKYDILGSAVPPFPTTWSDPAPQGAHLHGAGLGLFGLRVIPMVDRERERNALWSALGAVVRKKTPKVVLLRGASGSGKTRLARWLAERGHQVGTAQVLTASFAEVLGPGTGIAAMIEAFTQCQGLSGNETVERLRRWLRQRGIPDRFLAEGLAQLTHPAETRKLRRIRFRSPEERHALVRRLIQIICDERPVVMLLDDVQWGLEGLQLARMLLGTRRLPVLVVATVIDEELTRRPDEKAYLDLLLKHNDAHSLTVGPLPAENRKDLIERLLGLEGDLAHQVEQRTAGNPMFAVQLVGDWVQRGVLVPGQYGFELAKGASAEIPEDVKGAWTARAEQVLASHSFAEAQALELAALLGLEFDPDEWRTACGIALADASPNLVNALLDQRLLHRERDDLVFAHGLLREVLAERAEGGMRARSHHDAIAQVLEERPDAPNRNERLAHHLIGAHRYLAALTPILTALRLHVDQGELAEADALLALYEQTAVEGRLPPSDKRWGEGWLNHFLILRPRGDYARAEAWVERVSRAARSHDWPRIALIADCQRGRLLRVRSQVDNARAQLSGVARRAAMAGDREILAEARWQLGETLCQTGDLERALTVLGDATEDYAILEDAVGGARVYQARAEVLRQMGRHGDAAEMFVEARKLHEAAGNRWGVASAINSLGDVIRYLGDAETAIAHYRESGEIFEAIGSGSARTTEHNRGLAYLDVGDVEKARRVLEPTNAEFDRQGLSGILADSHLALAAVESATGNWKKVDEHLAAAEGLLDNTQVADEDTARVAETAARYALRNGDRRRAARADKIALKQWNLLDRADEIDATRSRLSR